MPPLDKLLTALAQAKRDYETAHAIGYYMQASRYANEIASLEADIRVALRLRTLDRMIGESNLKERGLRL